MLGYAVCAGAWLIGRAMHLAAERHVARSLANGNRRSAMGALAAATLGRVWLVALAILLVGLAEREAGLAAAVLAAALVTVHLGARAIERLLEPEGTT
jgi:putative exporter of polyketide antibiotics